MRNYSTKNYTGDSVMDDWISSVVEEVKIRQKRDDDGINAEDYFEYFDDNGQRIYYAQKEWAKIQKPDPDRKEITARDHSAPRQNLTFIHGSEMYIMPLSVYDKGNKELVFRGDTTVPHPRCDNMYEVDIAALISNSPIPNTKLAWVHTAENILFDNNIVRIVSAQAILGKCTIPIITQYNDTSNKIKRYGVEYEHIFFQNWEGCLANVCPDLYTPEQKDHKLDKKRCNNKIFGTRYCVGWHSPSEKGLCSLMPGTPVFCEVGEIQGFIGFLVSTTYHCPEPRADQAIMQGFNNAIFWIRKLLELGTYLEYENYIPGWVRNFRRYEVPRVKVLNPINKISLGEFSFEKFIRSPVESIIRVYHKKVHKCMGVLVNEIKALVPCSCLFESPKKVTYDQWFEDNENMLPVDRAVIGVLGQATWNRNGPRNFIPVIEFGKDSRCDNHLIYDYAHIHLQFPPKDPRPAWFAALTREKFQKIIWNLPQADQIYGDCFYIYDEFRDPLGAKGVGSYVPRTRRIRFENWEACFKVVCNEEILSQPHSLEFKKTFIKEKCTSPYKEGNLNLESFEEYGSRFCVSADPYDGKDTGPLCAVANGMPVFCNSEETKGVIGYLNRVWTSCPGRNSSASKLERDRAILFSFDEYVPEIQEGSPLWNVRGILGLSKAETLLPRLSPLFMLLASSIVGLL
ncbi:hypothetical protein GE061_008389 [Apolygus lucorum]|uniref:Uncharacterized protein n=1 Tax=Apolygus lucorum TaxID=248454 RepID=A0A8S9WPR1_APOLU|nr:hypothetical protein GE061_008389 [Apolygus lucorum]